MKTIIVVFGLLFLSCDYQLFDKPRIFPKVYRGVLQEITYHSSGWNRSRRSKIRTDIFSCMVLGSPSIVFGDSVFTVSRYGSTYISFNSIDREYPIY